MEGVVSKRFSGLTPNRCLFLAHNIWLLSLNARWFELSFISYPILLFSLTRYSSTCFQCSASMPFYLNLIACRRIRWKMIYSIFWFSENEVRKGSPRWEMGIATGQFVMKTDWLFLWERFLWLRTCFKVCLFQRSQWIKYCLRWI